MKILQILKRVIVKIIKMLYRVFCIFIPVKRNSVVFMSFHGRGFLDNPKAIYQAMRDDPQFCDYTFYWILRNKYEVPKGATAVKYMSISYFFVLARAEYWIMNCKLPQYVYKKHDQIYLQTWHGTPLKRLGHDIEVNPQTKFYRSGLNLEEMKCTYDDDVSKYDYMISPNRFCSRIFPSAFHIAEEKLIETGYPRNDILSLYDEKEIIKIKQKLQLPLNKKIILYAPTWRDNSFIAQGYTFSLKADFYYWKEKLKEKYIVLFKPHYLIVNTETDQKEDEVKDFLYTIDSDHDINELYLISDILITDYSSVFFDYAILERPIYFYMYDRKEYQEQLRGFYLNVDTDLPGQIFVDEEAMLKAILDNDYDYEKLKEFNQEFNSFQDGHCAEKVIARVFH